MGLLAFLGDIAGSNGKPVVLVELSPPYRKLSLGGRERPERPLQRVHTQRSKQTYYPGSKRASVQVLGSHDEPIVLRGWFNNPSNAIDGGARVRELTLRALAKSGSLISLTWGTHIVVNGRVQQVKTDWRKANQCRYEFTFEVDQNNEPEALTPLPLIGSAADELTEAIGTAGQAMEAGREAARGVRSVRVYT